MSHNQLRSSTSIDGNSANGSAIQNIFYINMKVNNDLGHIPDGIRYLVKYFMRGLENRPHGMTNPLTKQKGCFYYPILYIYRHNKVFTNLKCSTELFRQLRRQFTFSDR